MSAQSQWRRLVGKALLSTGVAREQISELTPLQTGIGIKGATEAVALTCQGLVEQLGQQESWVMLKVDLSNAFNTVSRQEVLRGALNLCPVAYNFLRTAYRTQAPLFSGGRILWSREGTHQGCPLGPLGFALGIHPVIQSLHQEYRLHWQSWYLDDGVLFGPPDQVAEALKAMTDQFAQRGLQINLNKCELWGPAVSRWEGAEVKCIPWEPESGVTVLGVPINFPGSHSYAESYWTKVVDNLRAAIEKVTDVVDSQCAHHLLRKCLDACKVTHLLRTTDAYSASSPLEECEQIIFDGFVHIIGCAVPAPQRSQVGLPLRVGGCGVRCPMRIRPAARISALASYYTEGAAAVGAPDLVAQPRAAWLQPPLIELQAKLGANFDPVTAWLGRLDFVRNADKEQRQQKWWSEAIGKKEMQDLLDKSSPRDQARLLEQVSGVGSAFMSVPPSEPLKTIFSPHDYRVALQWWLGLTIVDLEDGACCPGCGERLDEFGDHLLCCKRNNYCTRHAAIQDRVFDAVLESGQSAAKEQRIPGSSERLRPADIKLDHWEGRHVALDLTISHGWQASERLRSTANIAVTRERWRAFLRKQEAAKHAKYDQPCADAQWNFRAMAFGTWGGMGPEGAKIFHRITKRAAGWQEGDLRACRQEEIRLSVGVALTRQILLFLNRKNFL